ncbi:MAG: flagellar motor switch protein FliG [Pirellulales bacterium]
MPHSEIRKAAVLLASLPKAEAAQLMAQLSPKQVALVSTEIAAIGTLSSDEQESAIRQFAEATPGSLRPGPGGLGRGPIEKTWGEDASGTSELVRQRIEAIPFDFLRKVDSQNLLPFILDEHPQTIALILSHLQPAQAADILSSLPSDRQPAVIRRIAGMGRINREIIHEVETGLERRLSSLMSQQSESAGGVERVADILGATDSATERSLLESLAREDPELVEELRRSTIVFDDISRLPSKAV